VPRDEILLTLPVKGITHLYLVTVNPSGISQWIMPHRARTLEALRECERERERRQCFKKLQHPRYVRAVYHLQCSLRLGELARLADIRQTA